MSDIIEIKNLSKDYGKGENRVEALKKVNMTVQDATMLAIIGPSGSGKSTLLHMIGAMDKPTSGSICVQGEEITGLKVEQAAKYRCEKIGFVFQDFKLLEELTVRENILMPQLIAKRKIDESYYKEQIRLVGLEDRQNHLPGELSGGQKQRVAIARALINNPDIILADEPTGNLDSAMSGEIIELFQKVAGLKKTLLIVTHNQEVAAACDRQIQIVDGKVS